MATTKKKLSRAKAHAATTALATLLDGTQHDDRLTPGERAVLDVAHTLLREITGRLGTAEWHVYLDDEIKALFDQALRSP